MSDREEVSFFEKMQDEKKSLLNYMGKIQKLSIDALDGSVGMERAFRIIKHICEQQRELKGADDE